jgi:hypothetical protein
MTEKEIARQSRKEGAMRVLRLAAAVAISVLFLCRLAEAQSRPKADDPRFRKTVDTQRKIHRYLQSSVVPKLKPCWGKLQGKGTVEVRYRFADNGKGGWAFKSIQATRSDLPKGQDKAAADCMQRAVASTSFPKDAGVKASTYSLSWVWPVPLPPDSDPEMARRWGETGGGEGTGCDGHGAAARCVTCSGSPLTCVYVCVGADECSVQATKPGGFDSICSEGGQCASGGWWGSVGVMSIY